jgi:predicted ATPase
MTDPASTALLALLTHCLPAAYQYDRTRTRCSPARWCDCRSSTGTRRYPRGAYGSFAALIVSALRRYEEGYRFAKLGVDLAHKLNEPSVLSGVYFLWAMFASHWMKPIDEASTSIGRASIRAPERRPLARGLQRRSPILASAVPRLGRGRAARGRERDHRAAAAHRGLRPIPSS